MKIDLTQYITEYGIYKLKAKATDGTTYADSYFSNEVEYNLPLATISISGDNLTITNLSSDATGVQIYSDGVLSKTVEPSETIDLTQLDLPDGLHQIYIALIGGALRPNRSNEVTYRAGVVEFKDADWLTIKNVLQGRQYEKYGWAVGDTKTITLNGAEYVVRLSDIQAGRYNYSNSNKKTNGVIEMVGVLPQDAKMNSATTNVGGFAESLMRKSVNGLEGYQYNFFGWLPTDLQGLLEDIEIPTATSGTDTTELTSACKVFIPSAPEVGLLSSYGSAVDGTIWDWYSTHTGDTNRIKQKNGSNSYWWLRSPYPNSTDYFSNVNNYGNGRNRNATNGGGVVLCFAF